MGLEIPRGGRVRGQDNTFSGVGYPIIDANPEIQGYYERLRRQGESHSIAEMLAYRQAPGSLTDREFYAGQGTLRDQLDADHDPHYFRRVISGARKRGYTPTGNEVYVPGLARFPGDPEAFITEGLGEIKRRAEERGVGVQGFVNVKPREPEKDVLRAGFKSNGRRPIASDLQEMIREQMVRRNPDLKHRDLTEEINARHGNHVKAE